MRWRRSGWLGRGGRTMRGREGEREGGSEAGRGPVGRGGEEVVVVVVCYFHRLADYSVGVWGFEGSWTAWNTSE